MLNNKIAQKLSTLTEDQKERYEKAIAEGYKDEICSQCNTVFLAFHHFIRCDSNTCPMKLRDDKGHAPNVIEMFYDGVPGVKDRDDDKQ